MKDLIFEALVAEAQFRVAEHTIKGIELDEAIQEVASEMVLERDEVEELTARVKKIPSKTPRKVSEDDGEGDMADMVEPPMDDQPSPHSIEFSPDDLETATGVLMYKGIPWNNRTSTGLTFDGSHDVTRAREALARRWDFINGEDRTVASIDFDNLEDYQKVLDFIASKRMNVIVGGDADLDEDLDQQLAEDETRYKKSRRDAREQGLAAPEMPSRDMNYRALRKDALEDVAALDPLSNPRQRRIKINKRWK
jgi:hypothetical protein